MIGIGVRLGRFERGSGIQVRECIVALREKGFADNAGPKHALAGVAAAAAAE